MAQTVGPSVQLSDAIGGLASDTTEVGIVVGDMFRYACAGLFTREPESARFAMESRAWVAQSSMMLDRRMRAIIQQYAPVGEDMRRITELRQAISEYGRIADYAKNIADSALILGGATDAILQCWCASDTADILSILIAVVYEQMRGAFLVTAARDLRQARTLVSRDEDVRSFCDALMKRLRLAIHTDPMEAALPLQRLIAVAAHVREVDACLVAICKTVL
ncbi:MAG TPA: PhoU domain-containing protein [Ktedonobacterales bacterium]|nr:PhoU domain-containing protein [Ktedonobacterales bacterium]